MKLLHKTIAGGAIFIIAPLLLIWVFLITAGGRALRKDALANLATLHDSLNQFVSSTLLQEERVLQNFYNDQMIQKSGEVMTRGVSDLAQFYFDKYSTIYHNKKNYSGFFIADLNGQVVADTVDKSFDGKNIKNESYFQSAVQGQTAIGKLEFTKDNRPVVYITAPLILSDADKKIVGVMGAKYNLDTIGNELNKLRVGKTGFVFMTDETGKLITFPDRELLGKNSLSDLPGFGGIAESILKNSAENHTIRYRHKKILVFSKPIENTKWELILVIPQKEYLHVVNYLGAILLIIGLISLALIGYGIWRFFDISVAGPINQILSRVELIKNGFLNKSVCSQPGGSAANDQNEISAVERGIVVLAEHTRNVVSKISLTTLKVADSAQNSSDASQNTAAAVGQINNTIQDISRGATVQLDKINEIRSSFAGLIEKLHHITSFAEDTEKSAAESYTFAQSGKDSIQSLKKKIDMIAEVSAKSALTIQELKNSSRQIGEILSAITSFADQTNLLSLNAAIEAARAGEAGRGFAVVAEEVRKLAEGSAKATDNVSGLIKKILSDINQSVTTVVNSKTLAQEGAELINQTSKTQEVILTKAESVKTLMVNIAELVNYQLNISNSIMDQIKQVEGVSESNAANTQELTSTTQEIASSMDHLNNNARELTRTAGELKDLVSHFKLD